MSDELFPFMKLVHKIMHYIPHVLIILSIFSWIVIALTSEYYVLRSLFIFVPLILTSIFLIVNKNLCLDDGKSFLNINSSILTKIILVFISLQFISALLVGFTSPLFLILTVLIYLIIFFQIISKSPVKGIVLAEIFITTLILVLSQQLGVALWYGDGDLIGHYTCGAHIADIGYVSPEFYTNYIDGGWKDYSIFCLYHILIAIGIMIFGLLPNISLYIVSIVAVLTSVFFVYKLTAWFFNSYRAALLSAFFYSIMPSMLGAYLVPASRVMASAAFIIVLYLVFVLFSKQKKMSVILLLFMLTYMGLVHHAQHLFILATFSLLVLGVVLYYWGEIRYKYIPLVIAAFVSLMVLLIGYGETLVLILRDRLFSYVPKIDVPQTTITPSSTSNIIPSAGDSILSPELLLSSAEPNALLSTAIYVLPVSIMMIFCLVGIYYAVTKAQYVKKIGVLVPLLLVLFIPFLPGLLDMFEVISSSLQIYRYRILIAPLFAIVMGVGCTILMNCSKSNSLRLFTIIFSVLFIVVVASISGFGSNEVFQEDSQPSYFTKKDTVVLTKLPQITSDVNQIHGDREIAIYYYRMINGGSRNMLMDTELPLLLVDNISTEKHMELLLFPSYEFQFSGLKIYTGTDYNELSFGVVKPTDYVKWVVGKNLFLYMRIYSNSWNDVYHYSQ